MTLAAVAVTGILAAWFLATAIVQLPYAWCHGLRRFDPTGHLLPGWNFFAPKPIQADFAVFYRCWDCYYEDGKEVTDGAAVEWRELAGIGQRRITDGLVNPGRYARKSIFTCCTRITRSMQTLDYHPPAGADHPPDGILMSLPYLLLAEKVSVLAQGAVAVQYRIDVVRHDPDADRAATVFRSAVHQVVS